MYTIYNVRYGDTLETIAKAFNTTIEELKSLNSINLDSIFMGEQIIVPNNGREYLKTYVVITGDTLYDIARRNNIDVNTILLLNGLNKNDFLYPGQEIVLPSNNNVYITKDGDTLKDVLENSNLSYEELISKNMKIYLLPDQMIILGD